MPACCRLREWYLFAVILAFLAHAGFLLIAVLLEHLGILGLVESLSIVFTNCGNLILPIVSMTLGDNMVFYGSAFQLGFNFFFWTYAAARMQGSRRIDWKKVRADGVDFAVVKATQGRGEGALTRLLPRFTVSTFKQNVLGAAAAGLDVSVYHYFTGDTTERAISEADYFLNTIEPYHEKISGYAAVDVESKPYLSGLTPARLAAAVANQGGIGLIAASGMSNNELRYEIRMARSLTKGVIGINIMVAAKKFSEIVKTAIDELPASFRNDHDIWLAHWGVSRPLQVPYLQMWQYGCYSPDLHCRWGSPGRRMSMWH